MYIVRDIFYLKFGHYREAKALLDDAQQKNMLPKEQSARILTDFTGDAYRLILEANFNTLSDYEKHLESSMGKEEWKQWYDKFKPHVERSKREILKQVA